MICIPSIKFWTTHSVVEASGIYELVSSKLWPKKFPAFACLSLVVFPHATQSHPPASARQRFTGAGIHAVSPHAQAQVRMNIIVKFSFPKPKPKEGTCQDCKK